MGEESTGGRIFPGGRISKFSAGGGKGGWRHGISRCIKEISGFN